MNDILKIVAESTKARKSEQIPLPEFLDLCKNDPMAYSTISERLLKAIGKPILIDTSLDPRLSSIYGGRIIRIYSVFSDFYGIEEDIEKFVNFVINSAQGLEERKQIPFILGDVGSGKSTFVESIKRLAEVYPVHVLADKDGIVSPDFDNPLGLFLDHKEIFEGEYGIRARYFPAVLSPWALQRLRDYNGDISKFTVVKMFPSKATQTMIAKTEPLDPNNADQATLIGEVNMRELQHYPQNHPYAYNYSGALCRGNRGLVEMAEMYKGDIKTLSPLLEATQSRCFNGLKQVGSMPFDGMVLSHSNKSEYRRFLDDPKNEAMRDRLCVIKFHFSLRYTETSKILQKMINESDLISKPLIIDTIDILAKFNVLSILEDNKVPNLYSKMRIYNGDNIKNEDNTALPYADYIKNASQDEGMSGISMRSCFKIMSRVYNYHIEEVGADPVTLFAVLKDWIIEQQFAPELSVKYQKFITDWLEPKYVENLEKIIQRAYVESYEEYAQAKFDRYFILAQSWIFGRDYNDPVTGIRMDRDKLHESLSEMERSGSGIGDYKDFRNEIVLFIQEQKNQNTIVKWSSYKKLANLIEKSVFKNMKDILPIISFGVKSTEEDRKSHHQFLDNMKKLGYTEFQIKNLVGYYIQKQHS